MCRLAVHVLTAATLLAGAACAPTIGPRRIEATRVDYNEALARTWNEQMLLNLVRLRYRDTPMFLDITNVSTQYELSGAIDGGVTLLEGGAVDPVSIGAGAAWAERPTVSYTPLQGEQFARQLLSPIPVEHLLLLTRSGWRIDRVMRCCVKRVGDLWNAPTASGPTPVLAPRYQRFEQAVELLERLRSAQALDVIVRREGGEERLELAFEPIPGLEETSESLRELLGVPPEVSRLAITSTPVEGRFDVLYVEPRSMLGVLFYLSQGVEPPERDRRDGRVTVTYDEAGAEFDWSGMMGDIFWVRSAERPPEDAFVSVRYRDHWFWIADRDLSSKSTFGLLVQLFNLQAGDVRLAAPLLTLPVGS